MGPTIIYKDEFLVAVHKPSGWLAIPDRFDANLPSVKSWLSSQGVTPFVIHRIDKDTSGLILFALDAESHKYYNQLFEQREVEKKYLGLVHGSMPETKGTYNLPIEEHPAKAGCMRIGKKGKPSITHYQVIKSYRGYSWVSFHIETGRTHQIRVHLQSSGNYLACDPLYGEPSPILLSSFKKKFNLSRNELEERPLLSRLALHASSIACVDRMGKPIFIEAPLAKDLEVTLKQMDKWSKSA
jgi:23S rRNA pseudouridine955/2504/2580 synthase/23S rRNA pseudouridine1911/1915/1917 synthase